MLPEINLQRSALNFQDAASNNANLLSSDSTEPGTSFADQLKLGLKGDSGPELRGGQNLPEEGDLLPRGTEISGTAADLVSQILPGDPVVGPTGEFSSDSATIPALPEATLTNMPESLLPNSVVPDPVASGSTEVAKSAEGTIGQVMAIESAALELMNTDPRSYPVNFIIARFADLAAGSPAIDQRPTQIAAAVTDPLQATKLAVRVSYSAASGSRITEVALLSAADEGSHKTVPQAMPLSGNIHASLPNLQSASQPFATALPAAIAVNTPVQDPGWGEQIADRVLLLASSKLQNAEIRLTPAELGPLRVTIKVEDSATYVNFQAQHYVTREAIEQALPRLREMLAESGLTLGQASVSEHDVKHGHRDADRGPATEQRTRTADDSDINVGDAQSPPTRLARSDGLVDTFV